MAERVSQGVIEAAIDGAPNARASQQVIEAAIDGAPALRISQIPLQALIDGGPNARISQEIIEAIIDANPGVHISQIVIEVLALFIEVPVPLTYPELPGLTFPVGWETDWPNLETQIAADLSEFDLGIGDTPLHTFTLTYEYLDDRFGADHQRLLRGFFGAMRGNLIRFNFKHREDHQVRGQLVGTTDGTTRIYTLPRTYGVGEASFTEPVGYVDMTMPFVLYLDGVWQDPSTYTIDTTVPAEQQIIFAGTPTAGQDITADFDFLYYCKFQDKKMNLDKFMEAIWAGDSIKIRSCRARA